MAVLPPPQADVSSVYEPPSITVGTVKVETDGSGVFLLEVNGNDRGGFLNTADARALVAWITQHLEFAREDREREEWQDRVRTARERQAAEERLIHLREMAKR